ncbi:hypothetical protein PHISP_07005 [Aspergillus sp. HF37]|nr:hypothetical protein PHISP_07005 [Aspergillus sp. HF37]
MPRTLPWLSGESRNVKREPTPRKPRIEPESADSDPEASKIPQARSTANAPTKRDLFRSSQSPPASPIHRCPSEEYLQEGLDDDDIYIMVEDEFHAVAQSFTQHLHYAEYVRKNKEAKSQNEATIWALARPTDGSAMLEDTRKRKDAEAMAARQRAGLGQLEGDSEEKKLEEMEKAEEEDSKEEEEDSWAGTFLYDLMTSPRRAHSLVAPRAQAVRSSTRAAAGYSKPCGQSRQVDGSPTSPTGDGRRRRPSLEETASEDDDLKMQGNPPAREIPRPKQREENAGSNVSVTRYSPSSARSPQSESREMPSMHARYRKPSCAKSKRKMLFDDLDEFPGPNKQKNPVQERRDSYMQGAQKASGDQSKSKKSRLNEVPTFVL